jgi:hypothetical protein
MARTPKAGPKASVLPEVTEVSIGDVKQLNVPEFYGQTVQLFVSITDITIVFARPMPSDVPGQPPGGVLVPSVTVHMSPGAAKDLQLVLSRNLASLEKEWGTIETVYTRRIAAEDATEEKFQAS